MKFVAVSDTHSYFPDLGKEGEFVLHCGDMLPNFPNAYGRNEVPHQRKWIQDRIETFKDWLDGRPLIYVSGNHDWYTELWHDLTYNQIECHCINDKYLDFKGIKFYGFPWVPYIYGGWNFELSANDMGDKVDKLHHKFLENGMPDILAAHAPIANVLDFTKYKTHIGNTHMANAISYWWRDNLPKWFVCGHCHENNGLAKVFDMNVCNAATKPYLLEI